MLDGEIVEFFKEWIKKSKTPKLRDAEFWLHRIESGDLGVEKVLKNASAQFRAQGHKESEYLFDMLRLVLICRRAEIRNTAELAGALKRALEGDGTPYSAIPQMHRTYKHCKFVLDKSRKVINS